MASSPLSARSSRLLLSLAALLFLLFAGESRAADSVWITTEDEQAVKDSAAAAEVYCAGGFQGEVDAADRDVMVSAVGGENTVLEVLIEAESQDDLGSVAADKFGGGAAVGIVAGRIAFGFVLIVFGFCCCWYSCCPCYRYCRCCARPRKTNKFIKLGTIASIGGIGFGVVLVSALATSGYNKAVNGFENLACSAANLLQGMLAGQDDPKFLGFMGILQIFQDIDDSLDQNGQFMTDINSAIDETQVIQDSVDLASQTIKLLQDALSNLPSEVADNDHSCRFCTALIEPLQTMVELLDSSVASTLAEARTEIKSQLNEDASEELQTSLRSAATPLTEVKDMMRTNLEFFTDTDKFLQVKGHLDGDGPNTVKHVVRIIVAWAVILLCFLFLTLLCWLLDEGPLEKPNRWVSRCAGCNWCCGWCFSIFGFMIGGIMTAVVYPLSSVCLIMDDMNVDLLKQIAPALGLDLSGDDQQMLDIVEQCIVPNSTIAGTNPALLDLIQVDAEDGTKVSLRKQIVGQVKDQIDASFAEIDKVMGNMTMKMTDNEQVQSLIKMLEDPIDMMILFTDTTDYADLVGAAGLADVAAGSSVKCSDGTVGAEFPDESLRGQSIKGIESFLDVLDDYGTRVGAGCATLSVTCTSSDTAERAACESGNNLLTAKNRIRAATTWKCDVFEDPDNSLLECDPKNMAEDSTSSGTKTEWTNTCQSSDGSLKIKEKSCATLDEFVIYIQDFGARIQNTLNRIDVAVEEAGPAMTNTIRTSVNTTILAPMQEIVDGVTCGFMASFYREVVDGLCYQGVVGFARIGNSYQWCGGLALVMILISYAVWRRTVDNLNAAAKARKAGEGKGEQEADYEPTDRE